MEYMLTLTTKTTPIWQSHGVLSGVGSETPDHLANRRGLDMCGADLRSVGQGAEFKSRPNGMVDPKGNALRKSCSKEAPGFSGEPFVVGFIVCTVLQSTPSWWLPRVT